MLREYTRMTVIVFLWLIIGGLNLKSQAAPMNGSLPTSSPPPTLKDFEKQADELIGYITKMILPYFVQNADVRIGSQCTKSIIKIFSDSKRMKYTAFKLLDSMAKPVSGMMEGAFAVMGDYEECLSISVSKKKEPSNDPKDELFHGQYCTISVRLPTAFTEAIEGYDDGSVNASQLGKFHDIIENIPLKSFAREFFEYNIGVCIPSSCSMEDLRTLIALAPIPMPLEVKRCESNERKSLTYDQIVILTLFGLLALAVFTGTAVDGVLYLKDDTYKGRHNGKLIQVLLSFSVYNNTKKFMKTQKNAASEVTCINGMYVTGTFLVVLYHTYFVPFLHYVYRHASHIDDYFQNFGFTLISTMSISIESYFVFSGFFLVYARWSWAGGKEVKISIPRLIVRRYLRLTPSMLFVLGIMIILPVFGNGPIWEDVFGLASENTRKWWWKYVLMMNNFLLPKDQNYLYLWFIPCLMQVTTVGIFLAWILSKKPKLGIAAIVLTGVACNAGMGVMTYQNNYPPTYAIYFLTGREAYEIPIYTAPLSHVCSFCIGMLLGHYMSQNKVISFKPVTVVIGWIMCFALTVGTQWIMFIYHDGKVPNPIFSAVYAATHRTAYSLGMVWLIVACTHGYGGVLGKMLCWKGYGPLSKLGYSGYVVHYLIIAYHISIARTPMMYSHFEIWIRAFSYNSFTFAFAYLMYVTFELPLNYLESWFFARRPEPKLNGAIANGTDKIPGKDKISDVTVPSVPVQPVWPQNGIYRSSENSRL